MGTLTVRNLDESVKTRLRIQAAKHGWAMEEEVRRILSQATLGLEQDIALGSRIHARFKQLNGLEIPARSLPRTPPKL